MTGERKQGANREKAEFERAIIAAYEKAIRAWLPGQPITEAARRRAQQAATRSWRLVENAEAGVLLMPGPRQYHAAKDQLASIAKLARRLDDEVAALGDVASASAYFTFHNVFPELRRLADACETAEPPKAKRKRPEQPALVKKIARDVIADFEAITGKKAKDLPRGTGRRADETGQRGIVPLIAAIFAALEIKQDARTSFDVALRTRPK